jgi:hypothetical protein
MTASTEGIRDFVSMFDFENLIDNEKSSVRDNPRVFEKIADLESFNDGENLPSAEEYL